MEFYVQGIPNWDCNVVRCKECSNADQGCSFCFCVGGYACEGIIVQVLEIECQSGCGQSL
jgi:hypothetical protein